MNKHIVFFSRGPINDQHIFKDLILVPSMLNKMYGFRVTIAATEINEDLLHSEFENVDVEILDASKDFKESAIECVIKHGEDIDILFICGPYFDYSYIVDVYKKINPNGKVYLKLDMNRAWLLNLEKLDLLLPMLNRADLITVEDRNLQRYINYKFNYDVEYLRNGYYGDFENQFIDYDKKENTIVSVGRIGSYQKATEVLIEAFLKADLEGWKLKLIGSIDEGFMDKIEKFKNNPKFKEQVEFTGVISDKNILNNEYRKAKILAMSSRVEGCAHVFPEAALNRCYIVSTDVDGISDMIEYSSIVPVDDVDAFASALQDVVNNEEKAKQNSLALQEYTINECKWDRIIGRLYLLFCVKGLV